MGGLAACAVQVQYPCFVDRGPSSPAIGPWARRWCPCAAPGGTWLHDGGTRLL